MMMENNTYVDDGVCFEPVLKRLVVGRGEHLEDEGRGRRERHIQMEQT